VICDRDESGRMSGVLAVCSERVGGIVCHTQIVFDLTFCVHLRVTFRAGVMPHGEIQVEHCGNENEVREQYAAGNEGSRLRKWNPRSGTIM
jgi:hypothetical protein